MAKGEENNKSETKKKITSTGKNSGKTTKSTKGSAKSSSSKSTRANADSKGNDERPLVEVGKTNVKVSGVKMKKKTALALALTIVAIILIAAIVFAVVYTTNIDFKNQVDEWIYYSILHRDENSGGANNKGDDAPTVIADGELQVHMINVGQGDCIFIKLPDGKDMIIDCANYNNTGSIKESTMAYLDTYVTDGQIDYLMLTHCDSDHVYFLDDVIDRYDVDNIYMPNVKSVPTSSAWQATIADLPAEKVDMFTDPDTVDSACYAAFFVAALTEPDCTVKLNIGNFQISGESYTIDFFCYTQEEWDSTNLSNAERKNAVSPIGILQYNGKRVVLTGDSNEINEPKFIEKAKEYYGVDKLDCDVLKVGHHGSETSTTNEFLDFITVEYAFISCNASGNTFNHPRQATLDRLIARNVTFYRTDLNGTIVCKISGTTISFEVETEVDTELLKQGLTGETS